MLQANCRLVDNLAFSPGITFNQNALVISLKGQDIALWVLIFFLIQTYLLMLRTGNRVTWLGAAWRDLKRVFSKIKSQYFQPIFLAFNNFAQIIVCRLTGFWLMYQVRFAGGRVTCWSLLECGPSTIKSRLKISPLKCSWSWSAPPPDTWEKHASISQPCFPPQGDHLSLAPTILGPWRGTTTMRRSPNFESVAKNGPSWLTWVDF